jgi:hypothetical protein
MVIETSSSKAGRWHEGVILRDVARRSTEHQLADCRRGRKKRQWLARRWICIVFLLRVANVDGGHADLAFPLSSLYMVWPEAVSGNFAVSVCAFVGRKDGATWDLPCQRVISLGSR